MTFEDLQKMALSFPEVEEYQLFDSTAYRIRKRLLACPAKIDPDTLMIKVPDKLEREFLLSTKPDIYYLTSHYEGYNCLLVRMPCADAEEIQDLFEQAWLAYAPKTLIKAYRKDE